MNSTDQGRAFRGDADHDFSAIIARGGSHEVAKILQARYETAGSGGRVAHFLRDLRHAQHFLSIEICEKKELGKRNIARCEFLGEMQQKTALHFQNDVGKLFGIRTSLIRRNSRKLPNRSRIQRDKLGTRG